MEGAVRTLCAELRLFFPVTFPYYSILPYPGLYIGWRCPHYLWDCFRIGDESKCFCGHLLREHQIISGVEGNCLLSCVEMCERMCVCIGFGERLTWEGQAQSSVGLTLFTDISVPCNVGQCRCLMFCFIPSRPEEVGEFWLKRRATFDPRAWRAQCRCKHSHEDHTATGSHSCRVKGTFLSKGSAWVGIGWDRLQVVWGCRWGARRRDLGMQLVRKM